jgi:hypothetical protein
MISLVIYWGKCNWISEINADTEWPTLLCEYIFARLSYIMCMSVVARFKSSGFIKIKKEQTRWEELSNRRTRRHCIPILYSHSNSMSENGMCIDHFCYWMCHYVWTVQKFTSFPYLPMVIKELGPCLCMTDYKCALHFYLHVINCPRLLHFKYTINNATMIFKIKDVKYDFH